MSSRPIRVATLCHHKDDGSNKVHSLMRIKLIKEAGGYVWRLADGSEAGVMGMHKSVRGAEVAAMQTWGADEWDLRATWRGRGGYYIKKSRDCSESCFYPGDSPKDAFLAMLADSGDEYGSETAGTEHDWIIY